MLEAQQAAPLFTVLNQQQQPVDLSSYKGNKNVVLYFYPKDDTPGCTIEANQFSALAEQFAQFDTVILGVSKDDCQSHQTFIEKYQLSIELLSDTSGELCQTYGVWQEKKKNGETKMGIVRSTFIIDKQGALVDVMYGVAAEGHAEQILEKVKAFVQVA